MVTVKDVLNLGIFEDIWLAAPCEGCEERLVTGAGILDFEPFWGDYDSFTPGEFIFTSLGFAQRDPDLADQAVRAMIERDVAALVIKPVAMDAISAEAAELSTARGVPVFFYEGHFVERLMAAVLALVAEDRAQSQRDALIDALIAPRGDADVREGLFEVARTTGATVQCRPAPWRPTVACSRRSRASSARCSTTSSAIRRASFRPASCATATSCSPSSPTTGRLAAPSPGPRPTWWLA